MIGFWKYDNPDGMREYICKCCGHRNDFTICEYCGNGKEDEKDIKKGDSNNETE